MAAKKAPRVIHPTLCEANKLLLIFNNLKITSNEAVALWSLLEDIDPEFAGIGQIDAAVTVTQPEVKLWAQRGLYFWCLSGAVGAAGLPAEALTLTDRARLQPAHEHAGDNGDDDFDDDEDLAAAAPELGLEDFWCRLYGFCTLFDRTRQLKFAFRQLQHDMGPAKVRRFGKDVVHKKELVAMVATLHGEYSGPRELEKVLSYVTFDDKECVDFSAFTRLNMIVKTLLKPLDGLRLLLRKRWLGERFWGKHDRVREHLEAENLRDLSDLLRSGHFASRRFDYSGDVNGGGVSGGGSKLPTSLKAIREAMALQKEKAKSAAKIRPEIPVPVGERKGTWWREVSLVRQKKKKKQAASRDGSSGGTEAERHEAQELAKEVVEKDTADVLVTIRQSKRDAKAVLARSRRVL
mmetsp:Transcript_65954/g.132831  ORF Transcript_65954/g.132831 Transcript_65954/m.132831 type:complete len:407 (+) Transcript_65954:134-1354(+)